MKLLENFFLDSCHSLYLLFPSDLMDYRRENHKLRKKIVRQSSDVYDKLLFCFLSFSKLPYFAMEIYP